MAKKKYYAVAAGRSCGIYTDWATAEKQVKGFAGAKYKSFTSEGEARAWLENPVYEKKTRPDTGTRSAGSVVTVPTDAVAVYTDGGSINNPGPGGFGIVIEEDGQQREISGGFRLTTNNRMEMTAAIVALTHLQGCSRAIHLFSDSSYLVNGVEKGWARQWRRRGWLKSDGTPAQNRDLWQQLLALLDELTVSFHWVKGHAGHEQNERCDRLAVSASRQPGLPADQVYERMRQEQDGVSQ